MGAVTASTKENWLPACMLRGGYLPVPGYKDKLGTSTKHSAHCMECDVVSFADQCVDAYVSLAAIPVAEPSPKTTKN